MLLKKIVTSSFTNIFFAVGLAFTMLLGNKINSYFIYCFAILLTAQLVSFAIYMVNDLRRKKNWRKQMEHSVIYQSVNFEWQVNEQGDFFGKNLFTLKNIGDKSISILPYDNAIWFKSPTKSKIAIRILNSGNKQYYISECIKNSYQMLLGILSGNKANVFSWSNVIEPPLDPGEILKYQIIFETSETEHAAFSSSGTYAGLPTNIPTKFVSLKYMAPKGYRFKILDPLIILDHSGSRIEIKSNRNNGPSVSENGSFLEWQLHDLQTGLRYWFKYMFVKDAK